MLTVFGIPNCDSCTKARQWLQSSGIEYRFHDVRKDGLDRALLVRWEQRAGWKKILNTRSTTWRGLADSDKTDLDAAKAVELILANPTLLKRPVADDGETILVGFSLTSYAGLAK